MIKPEHIRLESYKRQIGVCMVLLNYIIRLFPNSELGSNLQQAINYLEKSNDDLDQMIIVCQMSRDSAVMGAGKQP